MVPWRVAKALLTLRDQVKAAYPGTPNPGFIGDKNHATRESDHNPWVDDPASSLNVVTAGDWYDDPAAGFDAHQFALNLARVKDPRVKYVISRRRIWSLARESEGWRPYNGPNPHIGHAHVSVSSSKSLYDSTRAWVIVRGPAGGGGPTPPPNTEDEMTAAQMQELKNFIEQRVKAYSDRNAVNLRQQLVTFRKSLNEDREADLDQFERDLLAAETAQAAARKDTQ